MIMKSIRGLEMNREQRRLRDKQIKRDRKKFLSLYNQLLESYPYGQQYLTDKIMELFNHYGEQVKKDSVEDI